MKTLNIDINVLNGFNLHSPSSTFHILHSIFDTLPSAVHTPHSGSHTAGVTTRFCMQLRPAFPLCTLYLRFAPTFTIGILRFTFRTLHLTLCSLHVTLFMTHFALSTPLCTLRFALDTSHSQFTRYMLDSDSPFNTPSSSHFIFCIPFPVAPMR